MYLQIRMQNEVLTRFVAQHMIIDKMEVTEII